MRPHDVLLSPDDPPPVRLHRPDGRAPVVLTCDHAAAAVPRRLARLGLDDAVFGLHVAYDLGAAETALILADLLDAPLALSGYSRLVIDCNRDPAAADAMPPTSDAIPIPGNQHLTPEARAQRVAALFTPYHTALNGLIQTRIDAGGQPAVISLHSFTPCMAGFQRPWHAGVLWGEDDRLAAPLLAGLRAEEGLCVGDNQPYSGRDPHGYTLRTHAEARGLPHVSIEVRQDLLTSPAEHRAWAERLARILAPAIQACAW